MYIVYTYLCMVLANPTYAQGWPGPYVYTVFDRILGDFPANIPYTHRIYGSGQPYTYHISFNNSAA